MSNFLEILLVISKFFKVREEHPHLVLGNVSLARKMGFPEVILPGDIRNDLYLTLVSGEFTKGNKSSDKNVELTVTVCNENGEAIPVSHFMFSKFQYLIIFIHFRVL